MPTYDREGVFASDFARLTPAQQALFLTADRQMVGDLQAKRQFRPGLRITGVRGRPGIFEMTWQMPDGRATFRYGPEVHPGEPHIIWRRVGGHDIFGNP